MGWRPVLLACGSAIATLTPSGLAQETSNTAPNTAVPSPLDAPPNAALRPADSRSSESTTVPDLPPLPPQVAPPQSLSAGEYILEFDRSPIVGTRLQLRSIYDESVCGLLRTLVTGQSKRPKFWFDFAIPLLSMPPRSEPHGFNQWHQRR